MVPTSLWLQSAGKVPSVHGPVATGQQILYAGAPSCLFPVWGHSWQKQKYLRYWLDKHQTGIMVTEAVLRKSRSSPVHLHAHLHFSLHAGHWGSIYTSGKCTATRSQYSSPDTFLQSFLLQFPTCKITLTYLQSCYIPDAGSRNCCFLPYLVSEHKMTGKEIEACS